MTTHLQKIGGGDEKNVVLDNLTQIASMIDSNATDLALAFKGRGHGLSMLRQEIPGLLERARVVRATAHDDRRDDAQRGQEQSIVLGQSIWILDI